MNTFSPEGRIFQVEYAIEAIKVRFYTINCAFLHHTLRGALVYTFSLSFIFFLFSSYVLCLSLPSLHLSPPSPPSSHSPPSIAPQLGSTAVGIRTAEGVLLAVEKRVTSSLMEPSSIEKILEIDSHIGTVKRPKNGPSE